MSRSYSRTVHIPAFGARSLAILAVAATLVSGVVVSRAALGGIGTPTAQAQEAPVVEAMPLGETPAAATPVPAAPEVATAEDVISVVENPASVPDIAPAPETAPVAQEFAGFLPGESVVVNADGLNFRTAPSLQGDIAVILPPGLQATVVAGPTAADGYTWYQLEASGVTGWSAGEFLAPAGTILAFAAQAPVAPLFPLGSPVVVADGDLNLRAAAGLAGEIQDQLPTGTAATIAGGPTVVDGYTWYQLDVNGVSGWSAGEFLASA